MPVLLPGRWPFYLLVITAAFAAVLFGGLLALGFYVLLIPLLGLLVVAGLMAYPRFALWGVLVFSLGVAGLLELLAPQLRQLTWGAALMSMALGATAVVVRLMQPQKMQFSPGSKILIWYGLFGFVAIASLIPRGGVDGSLVSSLKGYVQAVGVLLAVVWMGYTRVDLDRFMRFLVWLAVVQLPFVLYQLLVLAPKRATLEYAQKGIVAADIIAGTFGGHMQGGGRSLNLAILCLVAAVYLLASWRQALISSTRMVAGGVLCLLPIMLSEVKIVLLLIPISLWMVFSDVVKKNPFKAVLGGGVAAGFLVLMLLGYMLLPSAESQKSRSFSSYVDEMISYNVGERGYGNALLNRTTVYSFWFRENVEGNHFVRSLIGYGPGATFSGSAVAGVSDLTEKYRRVGINLTGMSSILWEFGILGAVAVMGFVVSAFRAASRLRSMAELNAYRPAILSAQVGVMACGVALFHSGYFVFDFSHQVMLMLCVGVIAAFSYRSASDGGLVLK